MKMEGTENGTATFDLAGVRSGLPMREIRPGRYEGSVILNAAPTDERIAVVVNLVDDGGTAMNDSQEVQVLASQYPPVGAVGLTESQSLPVTVTTPVQGMIVARDFVVQGSTSPNARVRVYTTLYAPEGTRPLGVTSYGQANSSGSFRVPVHVGRLPSGTQANINVTTFDNAGNVSRPVYFNISVAP